MKGVNKTKIVYMANLNFVRLNRYLSILLSLGFVRKESNPTRSILYKTTRTGKDFLNGFLRLKKRVSKETEMRISA
jgi:predicted transcriptional regulator